MFGQHLLIGKIRLVVVALPLNGSREVIPVVSAYDQADSNMHILGVHVAKGGLSERCWSILFKPPAATWFFNPDWHNQRNSVSRPVLKRSESANEEALGTS